LKTALQNTKKIQSAYILEEGVEAIRSIRDKSWSNISGLASGLSYGLSFTNSVWATTTTQFVGDGFYRRFEVFDVYRDANNDIASSGTLSVGTKLFKVSVEYREGVATTTKSVSFYLAEIF